jgi:hypothetical protein
MSPGLMARQIAASLAGNGSAGDQMLSGITPGRSHRAFEREVGSVVQYQARKAGEPPRRFCRVQLLPSVPSAGSSLSLSFSPECPRAAAVHNDGVRIYRN